MILPPVAKLGEGNQLKQTCPCHYLEKDGEYNLIHSTSRTDQLGAWSEKA